MDDTFDCWHDAELIVVAVRVIVLLVRIKSDLVTLAVHDRWDS